MEPKHKRARVVFILISIYVLFQFFWWAFHIVSLHGEIRDLQLELLTDASAQRLAIEGYQKKVWMVRGEGTVFVSILLLGLWRLERYFRKEAALARQERNFMLSITHELKTPVAALRLFMDTLKRPQLKEEQREKLLNDALDETQRLDHLVENILLSTQLEKEDHQPYVSTFDLSALTTSVVQKLKGVIGKMHQLELDVSPLLQVNGDPNRIESIISNLYENATKYAPEGSVIHVGLKQEGRSIHLSVTDEGPGVPFQEKEEIFKKFYRVGNEDTRNAKGSGLGLYLVQRIAKEHNARVELTDNKPKGAIFNVVFPNAEKL